MNPIAIGGKLDKNILELAYRNGIFPWPLEQGELLAWFSPDPRGVLFLDEFTINSSFNKFLRKLEISKQFSWTTNHSFTRVMELCGQNDKRSKENDGFWITPELINVYTDLFLENKAYSIEIWNKNQELIGGLYGVKLGKYVSGESMFHLEDNASKYALFVLVNLLKEEKIEWIDTQMVSDILGKLGAREIPRKDFLILLKKSLE